jgi:hypothetical protein
MEYEPILALFQGFEPFFAPRICIRIRIRVKSRIRIRNINVMRIHNTGKMYRTIYLHDVSLSLHSSSQNHSVYAPDGLALRLPSLCRRRHFPAVSIAVAAPVLGVIVGVDDGIAAGKPGNGGGAGGAAPGHGAGAAS